MRCVMGAVAPHHAVVRFISVGFLAWVWGCADGVEAPSIDANDAASAALSAGDKDGDGKISSVELNSLPGLKAAAKSVDVNQDRTITEEELALRLKKYGDDGIGLLPFRCKVTVGGQPLAGAQVRLAPEGYLGGAVQPATGVTDELGVAGLSTEGAINGIQGVQPGIYRVEIFKKDASGKELIAEKYNVKSVLGQEISLDLAASEQEIVFQLSK
jgi:hypothetical protein